MSDGIYAAVDLGSNSFHLVIAREINGAVVWLDRMKERVQLAQGLQDDNTLNDEAILRAKACLALFAARLSEFAPERVKTVATFTLRQAQNRDQVLSALAEVYPFPIEIVSGHDEAHLIYQGVAHTSADKGQRLVVDIGGGSTELIIGNGFEVLRAESRHLGCVRDSVLYFANNEPRATQFETAYQSALSRMEDLVWDYRKLGWAEAVGCSGTIRAISDVLQAQGITHGIITPQALQQLKALWLEGQTINGITPERAALLGAGLAILCAVFDGLKVESMSISESALREGLLYGVMGTAAEGEVWQRTIDTLQRHYHVDKNHALRVKNQLLALLTTAKIEPQSALGRVLQAAAGLYDVGRIVHHKNYQKHSAYLMENSELNGFSREDKALLTWLIRYQCKSLKGAELAGFGMEAWGALLALRVVLLFERVHQPNAMPEMLLSWSGEGLCLEIAPHAALEPAFCQALWQEREWLAKVGVGLLLVGVS